MNIYLCGDVGEFWKLEREYFWNLANRYIMLWNENPNRVDGRNMNRIKDDIYQLLFSSPYLHIKVLGFFHFNSNELEDDELYNWGKEMINHLYRYRFNELSLNIMNDIVLVMPPKKYFKDFKDFKFKDINQSRKRKYKE